MNISTQYYGFSNIDYARDKVDKYVPTLFIGLGGTGKNVLLRFRKNLTEEYGAQWREEFARFLVIDTDDQKTDDEFLQVALRAERGEFISCNFTDQNYREAIRDFTQRSDRRFSGWMHPDFENLVPRTAVQQGAGTFRQAGRLAFFLKYAFIRDQILLHMRTALDFVARRPQQLFGRPAEVYTDRMEVVIVTSLAGGTGSGMFLDTAYLVRHLFEEIPDFSKTATHTTLIGVLPNAFCHQSPNLSTRFRQNGYAALLEIEHYNTPRPVDPFGRGEGKRFERPAFVVNWSEATGADTVIRTRPWDTCYLIDDVTDMQRTLKSSVDDVYQLVADYLFLDFGNNPFAVAKRSARSNHSQLTDRTVGEQVLAPETFDNRAERNLARRQQVGPPPVVFENFYGCTYSSFGLAEIFIDIDRLIRASSYRLAERVIRERWLGRPEKLAESAFLGMVEEDLKGGTIPVGETKSVDFSRDSLLDSLLKPSEKDLRNYVRDEFARLKRTTDTGRMQSELDALLVRLNTLSSPPSRSGGGEDYQVIAAAFRRLVGALPDIGPLRKRLQAMLRDRCEVSGTAVALRYLDALQLQFEKAARSARDAAAQTSVTEGSLFDRLEDAAQVGFPCTATAVRIEFRKVLNSAESLAWRRYTKRAGDYLEKLYGVLREFVGSSKQLNVEWGAPTLWRACQQRCEVLDKLAGYAEGRFKNVAQFKGSDRKQSLMPAIDSATSYYDELIDQALINNPAIGQAHPEDPSFKPDAAFSWDRAEKQILSEVPSEDGGKGGATRMDVVDLWFEDYRRNKDRLPAIIEVLASCCRKVIENHLKLRDVDSANAVNYIMGLDAARSLREQRIVNLVQSSSTHLPLRSEAERFRPAFRNLLGLSEGEDRGTIENSRKFESDVISQVQTQRGVDPEQSRLHETRAFVPSKIVLVRELAGVPLRIYDRLKELGEAYFHPSVAQQRLTAHVRYMEGFEDLPDIEPISSDSFDRIQKNILEVLRGILLEFVTYQPDSHRFVVDISDSRRSATTTHNLGSRLTRILQHASIKTEITTFLGRQWEEWRGKVQMGQPVYLALLYCAVQKTLAEFPNEIDFREQSTRLPLQVCLEYLLDSVETLLKDSGEEGSQLFEQLRYRNEMDPDATAWKAWQQRFWKRLEKRGDQRRADFIEPVLDDGVIVRLSDALPFHTVRWRAIKADPKLQLDADPRKLDPVKLGFDYEPAVAP